MTPRDAEALAAALESGDVTETLRVLSPLTEDARRRLAPLSIARIGELKDEFEIVPLDQNAYSMRRRVSRSGEPEGAATVAAFGTCTATELRRLARGPGFARFAKPEIIVAAVRPRAEARIVEIVDWLCRPGTGRWDVAHALVREGSCPRPGHDDWIVGLYEHGPHGRLRDRSPLVAAGRTVLDVLREDTVLRDDVWRLFEVEGAPELSLATYDASWPERGWHGALLALASEGVLSRQRLLDASLQALGRDFTPYHATWYARFHEALAPSASERRARLAAYVRLLASQVPATAALAIDSIDFIVGNERAAGPATTDDHAQSRIVSALGQALPGLKKLPALKALRMLRRMAACDARLAPEAAQAAASALLSRIAGVQDEGIALLRTLGDIHDPRLRRDVAEALPIVAPRLREHLAPWLEASPGLADDTVDLRTAPEGSGARRDAAGEPVSPPISSLDDLVLACSALIEDASDPMVIERVMDGLSRLCGDRPPDFDRRTSALGKRCRGLLGARGAESRMSALQRRLCLLMLGWLEQEPHPDAAFPLRWKQEIGNAGAFLFARLDALTRHAASGRGLPLLAAPSWRSGWVEPKDVVTRWLAWQQAGVEPDIHEQVAALLRLHPDGRSLALAAAASVHAGAGDALRLALGDERSPVGAPAAAWLASARARDPLADFDDLDRAHPGLGPDGGRAARISWRALHREHPPYRHFEIETRAEPALPPAIPSAMLPVLLHQPWNPNAGHLYGEIPDDARLVRWSLTIWPAHHESTLAIAATHLAGADSAAHRELRPFVELLAAPHVALGPMARLVLALALASSMPELRVPAQDALIASVGQDRVDAQAIGETMATLFESGENTLCRWSKSLRIVSEQSMTCARVVKAMLEVAITRPPRVLPPLAGTMLELLADLVAVTGEPVAREACRQALATIAGTGSAARCARRLLG